MISFRFVECVLIYFFPAKVVARKRPFDEENGEKSDEEEEDMDETIGSDLDEEKRSHQTRINLSSIKDKGQVPIKVKCWDCSSVVKTSEFFISAGIQTLNTHSVHSF